MAVELAGGTGRRDFLPHLEDREEVPVWETSSYEKVVSAAFGERQAPNEYTDALKALNFTIGLALATRQGQTMDSFTGMYDAVVKGPQRARVSALKGLELASELGLATFPVNAEVIKQLRTPQENGMH